MKTARGDWSTKPAKAARPQRDGYPNLGSRPGRYAAPPAGWLQRTRDRGRRRVVVLGKIVVVATYHPEHGAAADVREVRPAPCGRRRNYVPGLPGRAHPPVRRLLAQPSPGPSIRCRKPRRSLHPEQRLATGAAGDDCQGEGRGPGCAGSPNADNNMLDRGPSLRRFAAGAEASRTTLGAGRPPVGAENPGQACFAA